jgi:hypothetical protein
MNDEADTTDNSKPRDGCSRVQRHAAKCLVCALTSALTVACISDCSSAQQSAATALQRDATLHLLRGVAAGLG